MLLLSRHRDAAACILGALDDGRIPSAREAECKSPAQEEGDVMCTSPDINRERARGASARSASSASAVSRACQHPIRRTAGRAVVDHLIGGDQVGR